MDFTAVVTFSALLLVTAEANGPSPTLNITTADNQSSRAPAGVSSASTTKPSIVNTPLTVSGFLTVNWTSHCKGFLSFHVSSSQSHVCYDSEATVSTLLGNVCQRKKGCTDQQGNRYVKGLVGSGYNISAGGAQMTSCDRLDIHCKVVEQPDVRGQLRGYRVATALLSCVLLVLLLIRFTRPTVQALQKRLSNKRQNRWVGPTQSHSVSYQRGKKCKNDDGEKLSYPALERLTVSESREPSSNRNSDYNL